MPSRARTTRTTSRARIAPRVLVLRITLAYIQPPIWRIIQIPETYSLLQLHRALQIAFAWQERHLHAFDIAGARYSAPHPEMSEYESTDIALSKLKLVAGSSFTYTYDFGDDWRQLIEVVQAKRATDASEMVVALLDGARAAPPEDCGGPPGYEHLLEVLRKPKHPEYRELSEWLGRPFDSEAFDVFPLGNALVLAGLWGAI